MLGLSVLTAGTLAAGATGTLAWFTTNKTATATYKIIVAVGTQGNIKATISGVTDNAIKTKTEGNDFFMRVLRYRVYILSIHKETSGILFTVLSCFGYSGNLFCDFDYDSV